LLDLLESGGERRGHTVNTAATPSGTLTARQPDAQQPSEGGAQHGHTGQVDEEDRGGIDADAEQFG
jgi:hypothetical protein